MVRKARALSQDRNPSKKRRIQTEVEHAEQHQAQRLIADAPNRIAAYSLEMEVIEKLKRVYYFAKRMAKTVEVDAVAAQPAT